VLAWQQVSGAYAKRYEKARGLAWSSGAHVQALSDIADQLSRQDGDHLAHLARMLDAFFADDYVRERDFPLGLLAKQFGRFFKPPGDDARIDLAKQRKRGEEAQRRHEEAQAQAESAHAQEIRERTTNAPSAASEPEPVDPKAEVAAFRRVLGES
jgi:hypothetical protein